ncbi:hypothetical protein THAOC_15005, partial [Thalassiosira oceanica]
MGPESFGDHYLHGRFFENMGSSGEVPDIDLSKLATSNFGFPETPGLGMRYADIDLFEISSSSLPIIGLFAKSYTVPSFATLKGSKRLLIVANSPVYVIVDPAIQTVPTSQDVLRKNILENIV